MEKVDYKCYIDQCLYGVSFRKRIYRRWFNPLRYLFGRVKEVYLNPRDVYIKEEGGGRSEIDT